MNWLKISLILLIVGVVFLSGCVNKNGSLQNIENNMDALEEKHNERMIFINATDFMVNLDETIENILVEGGQKYISMNVPAEVTFDGEKIEMKIKQKGSVIASGGWVLLGKDSDVQGKAEELSTGGYDITIQLKYNESILTGNPFNFKNTGIIKIERIGEKVRVDIYE